MKPHKHAELIKSWADGATIEVLSGDNKWYVPPPPTISWAEYNIYRIKPKPEPVYRQLINGEIIEKGDEYLDTSCNRWVSYVGSVGSYFSGYCSELTRTTRPAPAPKPEVKADVVKQIYISTSGNSMSRPLFIDAKPANLKLTFDGETNQLKSAEVIK